ncbi:MBOAT family protein [Reichenbachiella agarivorans]|uniref:MBOAT family protein n=1 Tax=Reichenbachiella agarivorans TaxID=2979464 RepID=A0ABY6CPI5_9BACT|nr:MBOAT family O-acyltransferase [Reichenbachiella agarivorans]UXP32439.1 MBOAT family protein [Reichenbachiella agarivorans]
MSKVWLLLASLFFYGWWNPLYVTLIISSILVNYGFHKLIKAQHNGGRKKMLLVIGIGLNVSVLGYYKYADFFISNFNALTGDNYNLLHIILPLGISFFTFQQIAFLVDTYKDVVEEMELLNYALFVSFFPQLIAGPIVHHAEMMPQFFDQSKKRINAENISKGLFVFNMGLAKKVIVADAFGKIANAGYGHASILGTIDSWVTSLAYTVQLYFDFSGYTDMAIGIALFFNIIIPNNFWSPYKSSSIKEFWRKWHMTLSRFLRDYIYIPLGGNRKGAFRTRLNLMATFLIGGIWHGAGWTFLFWGFLHGLGLVIHSFFEKLKIRIPYVVGLGITFLFVNMAWVFFRAESWGDALHVLNSMIHLETTGEGFKLISQLYDFPIWVAGVVLLFAPNSQEFAERFQINARHAVVIVVLTVLNVTFLNSSIDQEFLYFDF